MLSNLQITRRRGGRSPLFVGQWNGRPVAISLDVSAMIKLDGRAIPNEYPWLPEDSRHKVTQATLRLLEMNLPDCQGDDISLTITALDLE